MAGTISAPSPLSPRASVSPLISRNLSGGRWPAAGTRSRRVLPGHAPTNPATPCPYVPRDQDAVIRTRLTRAADEGGLVLVVGDLTAGKMRACFEALRAQLPEYRGWPPTMARAC